MTTEEISAVLKNLKLNISADKVIVVDPETRTMTIPESVERLGTQSDEKTESILSARKLLEMILTCQ